MASLCRRAQRQTCPGIQKPEKLAHHVQGIGGVSPPMSRIKGII
jgi:hypothetical protein